MRTTELDADNRRPRARTSRYCVKCNQDIRPGGKARRIHLIAGGAQVLHPADESLYTPDSADMGMHLLGIDCARRVGLEWSVPE